MSVGILQINTRGSSMKSAVLGKQHAIAAKKTHLVGVSLDIDMYQKLKAMAEAEGRDPSNLAKPLLQWAIEAMARCSGHSSDFLAGKWKQPEGN